MASVNSWHLQATLPGAIIHDISLASPMTGYAAAELGQVWKTSDGGAHWAEVMNLGSPHYWYGVRALTENDVIISGFVDSANSQAVIRWTHDGGATWTQDIVFSTSTAPFDWSYRVRYTDPLNGFVLDSSAAIGHYTSDGGATSSDWTKVVIPSGGGWFGYEFSFLPNRHIRASGIDYCSSLNSGSSWTCKPSVDSVFDGETFFVDDNHGWVAGGAIYPNVEGWVHRTTDGGATWSPRTLDGPWPIRELRFLTPQIGWAAGGNIYSNVGGIHFSSDGGQTWSLDIDTGSEMDACDAVPETSSVQVWCAGYNASFAGVIYTLSLPSPSVGLGSSLNPALTTQTLNFTAKVSSASGTIPTGTVDFLDGSAAIGAGQGLDASGAATFSPISLAAGAHTITAVYNGDSTHLPSVSPPFTQVINNPADKVTSTVLTLIVAPARSGEPSNTIELNQDATLHAAVTPSPGSIGAVVFMKGNVALSTVSLTGGVASLDLNGQLGIGQTQIQALYTGGGGFQGNLQPLLLQHTPRPR